MIDVIRYTSEFRSIWNTFNKTSKTPLFMFDRDYMEYHKARFKDHSLLFFLESELVAILPICENSNSFISHGGLTYGGFVTNGRMKQHIMLDCFNALFEYATLHEISKIVYKTVPYFYQLQPSQEDRYALFVNNAKLLKVEASTLIDLCNPLKMPKGRKAQIARAKREGVIISELTTRDEFDIFIELENEVLQKRHNTIAVHSGEELFRLKTLFPNSIHLFGAFKNESLIAGVVIYEYANVIHTQYMAANQTAREIGALDLCVFSIMKMYESKVRWLDFGISTENSGKLLNRGLIAQKEGFGGRTAVYETWEICI